MAVCFVLPSAYQGDHRKSIRYGGGNKMKESIYKTYEELPLFLNAGTVAKVLGIAPSSTYKLMHIVVTNSVSLAPPQAAGLAHSVAPPLPTQTLCVCAGSPFFPVLKVGSRMVVPKEKFIQWVEGHTQGGTQ
jgi:hypothetical protein